MADNRNYSLRNKILDVFPKTPPPAFKEITSHRCSECNGVRDDFYKVEWWNADDDLIDDNFGKLPLFTAKSYHYYLPAFLLFSLKNFKPYNDVLQFVIYSLFPSERIDNMDFMKKRKSFFSKEQIQVITNFLDLVLKDEDVKIHHSDAEKALTFWS